MTRTQYRNGDEVQLSCGCDGCSPSMINGTLCHESGCPDAWRDYQVECSECGCDFYPETRHQNVCGGCIEDADNHFHDMDDYELDDIEDDFDDEDDFYDDGDDDWSDHDWDD